MTTSWVPIRMLSSPACNRVRMAKLARSPPGRSRSKRATRASGNWTLTASSTASVPNPEGSRRAPRQDGQFSGTCPVLPQWPHRSRPSCLWYTHPTAQAGHFTAWPQSRHWRTGEYPLRLRNRSAFLPAARQAAIASVSGGLSMVPKGASRRSTTVTGGAPSGVARSSRTSVPTACTVAREGCAEASTSTAPARPARSSATARASYRGTFSAL